MYAFVDRPVSQLCDSGRFLVWAMRSWMQSTKKGCCPPRALGRGFASIDGLSALPDFHIAMALFTRDALEEITIGSLDQPHVVEDESVLLGMWRDISLGDVDNARKTLKLVVEEDSVAPVCRAMTAATAEMIAGGFDLSGLSARIAEEAKPGDE